MFHSELLKAVVDDDSESQSASVFCKLIEPIPSTRPFVLKHQTPVTLNSVPSKQILVHFLIHTLKIRSRYRYMMLILILH